MHFKYGKVSGTGCPKQGMLGWDGVARENEAARQNGHSARMGYPGIWGSRLGLSTQEVWGCPEEMGCPFSIPRQPGRGRQSCRDSTYVCRERKGLTGFGYPPLCWTHWFIFSVPISFSHFLLLSLADWLKTLWVWRFLCQNSSDASWVPSSEYSWYLNVTVRWGLKDGLVSSF